MYQHKKMTGNENANPVIAAAHGRAGNAAISLADHRPSTLVQLKATTIQLKNGKGKKKKAAAPKESKAQRSLNNITAYRGGWVRKNNIDLAKMQAFIGTYSSGIRGHASGRPGDGEQGTTKTDLLAYKAWHTRTYQEWK